jgi:PAS domain S-box-containing protein
MEMVMAALQEQHFPFMENIPMHIGFVDKTDYYQLWNSYSEKMFGYTREEAIGRIRPLMLISSQQEADRITRIVSEKGMYDGEASMRHRSGSLIYAHLLVIPLKNKEGQIQGFYGFAEDITNQKAKDEELQKRKTEIEDINNVLRVLLQKRDEEKKEGEKHMFSAINKMIIPYVRQIKQRCTDPQILSYIDAIESNLKDFTIDFQVTLRSNAFNLSPTEIEVALFIKAGKTTKDIAQVLNISPETVESHRKNIRHKMGLQGKKKNLMSYLVVMDKM